MGVMGCWWCGRPSHVAIPATMHGQLLSVTLCRQCEIIVKPTRAIRDALELWAELTRAGPPAPAIFEDL